VHSFTYWIIEVLDYSSEISFTCATCDSCPVWEAGCLSNCSVEEYVDDNGVCTHCHSSCHRGCVNGEACTTCHPTCRTCVEGGTEEDNCTSCGCGAHLFDADSLTGSACECDSAFSGESGDCHRICPDRNCSKCRDYHDNLGCIECRFGYAINESGICSECMDDDCNNLLKPMSDACVCGASEWWDGNCCQECSEHCAHCRPTGPDHCSACEVGYYFAKDSDHCLEFCATGYLEVGTSKECWCSGSKVANFTFTLANSADL
jgi:hypothetical protein